MKTIYKKLLFILLLMPFIGLAQGTVSGTVLEEVSGQPLPGVNVVVRGTSNGTSTDLDGNFQLRGLQNGNVLVFSYIGFGEQTVTYNGQSVISVKMKEDSNQLQEVVIQVGYGTSTKKDATGAVAIVTTEDFNKGTITTADQLLTGRTPGVRITSAGGQPDAAPNIRIRGGASLNAQNNPLIVIDGVPLDYVTPAGVSNPLSLVNPNDIESFSILKDASATAIYGSRASNGVIIITTKRGTSGAPQFNYTSNVSWGKAKRAVDNMDGPTFSRFIQEYHPTYVGYLGIPTPGTSGIDDPATPEIENRTLYNTDWYDAVTRNTMVIDHALSARANLFGRIPVRASLGYTKNEGVVRTNDLERYTTSVKITPSFFDNHLKIDLDAKGIFVDRNAIDDSALAGALVMDPTKPVYAPGTQNNFGGYYQNTALNDPSRFDGQFNPVNLLMERRRPETVNKLLANLTLDYKFHFLPELRAVVNTGIEASRAKIDERFGNSAFATYRIDNETDQWNFHPGTNYRETQHITNRTLDTYLAYTKEFSGFVTRVDAQAGHTYQSFVNDGFRTIFQYNVNTGERELQVNTLNPNNRYYNKSVLESYFARANVDLFDRYLFTFTMRADGSSFFTEDNRWGYFPAAGFAWRVKDETFFKDNEFVNDLKVRVGYGITGQQDITQVAGYYPSSALFEPGGATSQYLPGYNIYNQKAFNRDLKWESTTTYNAGIDFSFFKNGRVFGSVDVYKRLTKDLLSSVQIPPGQALTNIFIQNVGTVEVEGAEVSLGVRPLVGEDYSWEVAGNISYNIGKVTGLGNYNQINAGGGVPVGTGQQVYRHAVGQQPMSAWVFEQLYDADGSPIIGAFRDLNNDGVINNDDRYYRAVQPNWTFGFSTNFNYKRWDLSATFHGQLDGEVYNGVELKHGWTDAARPNNSNSLTNVLDFYSGAGNPEVFNVQNNIPFSDYYMQNASFLRCDNITIGYKIPEITKKVSLRLYAGVNNAFLITKYDGVDPENFGAMDNNFYPRPRMYNFGVNLDF